MERTMKMSGVILGCCAALLAASVVDVYGWSASSSGRRKRTTRRRARSVKSVWNQHVGVGGRMYVEHSLCPDRPFKDGAWGYGLVYEYHERQGLWQLGLTYSGATEVLEPQVNLIFEDKGFCFGVGGTKAYQWNDLDKWHDAYWQMLGGFKLDLSRRIQVNLVTYYVFSSWSELDEFDTDDLEYGVWCRIML